MPVKFKKEKIDHLIKRELDNIILRELDIFPGTLLTITRVETARNMFEAKVYISVIPDDQFEAIFGLLSRHIYDLQQSLNKKLKIRPVPKIIFEKETKTKEAGRIDQLLFEIQKKESGKK
ncbi:MAG: 30S ribosome-binding factor RbfA [Candidatus Paceibacterota bacterium]